VTPFKFWRDRWLRKTRVMCCHVACLRDSMFRRFESIPACDRRTYDDGQYRTSIASCGKNGLSCQIQPWYTYTVYMASLSMHWPGGQKVKRQGHTVTKTWSHGCCCMWPLCYCCWRGTARRMTAQVSTFARIEIDLYKSDVIYRALSFIVSALLSKSWVDNGWNAQEWVSM